MRAFLRYLANPKSGRGSNVLAMNVSLPSRLQAFLHALLVTDQRLAGRDNAGKSTFSNGLQVVLERTETGEWEVLDWAVEGSPPRPESKGLLSKAEALQGIPGFRPSDGETSMSLLSENEMVLGTSRVGEQDLTWTTVGLRLGSILYEYPDLILGYRGEERILASLYDDLHLKLEQTSPAFPSVFHEMALFSNCVGLDRNGELNVDQARSMLRDRQRSSPLSRHSMTGIAGTGFGVVASTADDPRLWLVKPRTERSFPASVVELPRIEGSE